jgi:hypothetical protein
MNLEETYEQYTQGGASTAGGSTEYGEDQGPYNPPRYEEFLWSAGGSVEIGVIRL